MDLWIVGRTACATNAARAALDQAQAGILSRSQVRLGQGGSPSRRSETGHPKSNQAGQPAPLPKKL